jgi:hypothetical protein
MAEVSIELDKAHSRAARASGLLIAMVARRRFSERMARGALQDLESAATTLKALLRDIRGED